MSITYKLVILIIIAGCLLGFSCSRLSGRDYDIDKTSPDGTYRVRIEVRAKAPTGSRDYNEHARFQFFKGDEVVHAYEWEQSDQFEPSVQGLIPVVEWVDKNVLRMGAERTEQPFYDEVVILNNSSESLKHVGISYGRYEGFDIFDLASKSKVILHASPRFGPNGSFNRSLGYGGMTQSGKKFKGNREGRERKSPADGALNFQITINAEDLH
jgi:hypothetical protein